MTTTGVPGQTREHLRPGGHAFALNWALFTVLLGILAVAWSLATPLPSGPDESAHYVKAAAVVRGQLIGGDVGKGQAYATRVRVPGKLRYLGGGHSCYYRPSVSAACGSSDAPPSSGTVDAVTYVGRYPPLYYAITGTPSLFSTGRTGQRAMRVVSAVICAVLLGLAFATARQWSTDPLLVLGLGLGVTPAALYLASVVNPSGLEIAAAAALWVSVLVLFREHRPAPPPGLLAVVTTSAWVLAWTRPLSPLWVLAVVGTAFLLRPTAVRQLWRSGAARIGGGLAVLGVALAGAWTLIERSYQVERFPLPAGISTSRFQLQVLSHLGGTVRDLFGVYGSPNFQAPALVVAVWGSSLAVLLGAALLAGRGRDVAVLAGLFLTSVIALPLVADLAAGRTSGLHWQGRYEYPLAIGVPLVAAVALERAHLPLRRARVATAVAIGIGLLLSYYWVARRYLVGLPGTLNPFPSGPGVWRPPIPSVLLFIVVLLASAGYVTAVAWQSHQMSGTAVGGSEGESPSEETSATISPQVASPRGL